MKLNTMKQQDVEKYVEAIAKGEIKPEGMELVISDKLKAGGVKQKQFVDRLNQLNAEKNQVENELQLLAGESRGLMELLISAEDSRRTAAKPPTDVPLAVVKPLKTEGQPS